MKCKISLYRAMITNHFTTMDLEIWRAVSAKHNKFIGSGLFFLLFNNNDIE